MIQRILIWAATTALITVGIYFFGGFSNSGGTSRAGNEEPTERPFILENSDLSEFIKGGLHWTFKANRILYYKNSRRIRMETFFGLLYPDTKKEGWVKVWAGSALINLDSDIQKSGDKVRLQDVKLDGDVRILSDGGRELKTSEAFFDDGKQLIYNNAKVYVKDDADSLEGSSFRYFLKKDLLEISDPVVEYSVTL